jgi:hypothetical protein
MRRGRRRHDDGVEPEIGKLLVFAVRISADDLGQGRSGIAADVSDRNELAAFALIECLSIRLRDASGPDQSKF